MGGRLKVFECASGQSGGLRALGVSGFSRLELEHRWKSVAGFPEMFSYDNA